MHGLQHKLASVVNVILEQGDASPCFGESFARPHPTERAPSPWSRAVETMRDGTGVRCLVSAISAYALQYIPPLSFPVYPHSLHSPFSLSLTVLFALGTF